MKLKIENVAKVSKAEININGITLITGYNGSGKSTICKCLYKMLDCYSDLNSKILNEKKNSMSFVLSRWVDKMNEDINESYIKFFDIGDVFLDKLQEKNLKLDMLTKEILQEILQEPELDFSPSPEELDDLYQDIKEVIDTPNYVYAEFIIETDFKNAFGSQINPLYNEKTAFMELDYSDIVNTMEFERNSLKDCTLFQLDIKTPVYLDADNYFESMLRGRMRATERVNRINRLVQMTNKKVILEEYNQLKSNKEIVENIIKDVTHGDLVDTQGGLVFNENGKEINCKNIASGLKLFLLIQRMLENGTLNANSILIIDEPEVNLHPEWQVKLAEILVMIYVKLGIKIVLCTHSPYFMRAIEVNMANQEKAEYGKYYFMQTDDGSMYHAMDVTGRTEIVYETMYQPLENL